MINGFIIGLLLGVVITWDVFRRQRNLEKQAVAKSVEVLEDAACEFDRFRLIVRSSLRRESEDVAFAEARKRLQDSALSYAASRGYRIGPF